MSSCRGSRLEQGGGAGCPAGFRRQVLLPPRAGMVPRCSQSAELPFGSRERRAAWLEASPWPGMVMLAAPDALCHGAHGIAVCSCQGRSRSAGLRGKAKGRVCPGLVYTKR